ncbi:hypothetical protein Adt_42134 [Abeliophyllum distichum]|uniref:Uncharacterized protein n=1 Tax=Abeliophyllum distichum TaxID=126358 RepID=A0ABD1PSF7_9LAMI
MRSWSLLVEYIERWRNLVHNYKKCIDEASCIDTSKIARHRSYLSGNLRDKKDPKNEIKRDGKSGSNLGPKLKSEFRPNKAQVQKKGLLTLKEIKENDHPVEKHFLLKDLIVLLDKQNKIKLENGENPTANYSMVGSFDPIPISNEGHAFSSTYDVEKSLSEVTEFGPQFSKGAILVKLKVDGEVIITNVYPQMVKPDNGNCPTFYEIMIDDLDI